MQIRLHCPTDRCVAIIEFEPLEESGPAIECPRCREAHPVTLTESIEARHVVDRCAICGGEEMFVRKDFPQRLGVLIVVVFGLISIFCYRFNVVLSWAVLAAAVVVDLLIYFLIGRVTTCYACRAEYRRCQPNPAHEGFDLATSEKY
jgi:hypothetical protein